MTATVRGLPDVRRALQGLTPKLRSKILLPVLRSAARVTVLETARREAPVMSAAAAMRTPNRTPGLVRKSLAVRASKQAKRRGDVGVFVNVRPAKGARYSVRRSSVAGIKLTRRVLKRASQRGTASDPFYWLTRRVLKRASQRGTASDPFYWRFLEFGTSKMTARPFLGPAARRLRDALQIIRRELGAEFRPDGGGLRR